MWDIEVSVYIHLIKYNDSDINYSSLRELLMFCGGKLC